MEEVRVYEPEPRKIMPAQMTPSTNLTSVQTSLLDPFPLRIPNRPRKLSTNTLVQEIANLERRHLNDDRKPRSSQCEQSQGGRPASFKEIVYQHQLKQDLQTRYKGLAKYSQALSEDLQDELEYSTFKMVQQNQKNKINKIRTSQVHCKTITPRNSLEIQIESEMNQRRRRR